MFQLATVLIISVFGFIGFALILDKFAFNFMFLRLWQFSVGFSALFWSKIQENGTPSKTEKPSTFTCPLTKNDLVTVSLSALALCLSTMEIKVLVLRPLVTVATAVIIACESKNFQVSL